MDKHESKFQLIFQKAILITTAVILMDFIIPGERITDKVLQVKHEYQQHYNASRNHHFSCKIISGKYEFSVSEEFAKAVKKNDSIQFSVSRLFKENNWHRKSPDNDKTYHSLRIVSAAVIPLLTILMMITAARSRRNLSTAVFVFQSVLIADLIFILFY